MSDANNTNKIKDKLLKLLRIYPRISPSMLGVGMLPILAKDWRQTLESLISSNQVTYESVHVNGRVYQVVTLTNPNQNQSNQDTIPTIQAKEQLASTATS